MPTKRFFERFRLLGETNALLAQARTHDDIFETLRTQARALTGADGVAVVRREGEQVAYIGEDAISPLWTGQRFPIRQCISGLAILDRRPIAIPDIGVDPRVPLSAYLATFVRSMAVFPLGRPAPVAALGLYWREVQPLAPDVATLMDLLSQSANAAFESVALKAERRAGAAKAA